jgi:hypothetical protein
LGLEPGQKVLLILGFTHGWQNSLMRTACESTYHGFQTIQSRLELSYFLLRGCHVAHLL